MQRAELRVTGIVQGVGFRPFCVRTAESLGLRGTVRNTSGGVEVVLEGSGDAIDGFVRALWEDHPDAAVIREVEDVRVPLTNPVFSNFSVARSSTSGGGDAMIPADLAVCGDCLAEMRDPGNRRYRYPFINCTNCGPRYTIIRGLPYDRQFTTMSAFKMCPSCEREYGNPADRRYHAQPNACPECGPKVRLADRTGRVLCQGEEAVTRLISEIKAGGLAAVKGVGGFHIACLPEDGPIRELRLRKHRPDKPFALMTRDVEAARRLADVSPHAERLMKGVQRPIVLCPIKEKNKAQKNVSPLAAPGQRRLGLMLPYTPLHHLLMESFDALVMTRANISDAPIVSSEAEAFAELSGVVDFFLCHDREIYTAIDDSVLLPDSFSPEAAPIFLRRGRGYVPNPTALPFAAPDILAAGAQLKSTYTLTRGSALFPGQYLGDLDQLGTAAYYKNSLARFIGLYGIKPEIFAFDKHPGYAATELALEFAPGAQPCPVQHHHAHMASVMLDNGYFDPVIAAVFDGTGYGDDGINKNNKNNEINENIWGGEFLVGDALGFRRMGSLLPFRLPGGEKAIREPWRCALALLDRALGEDCAKEAAASLFPEPLFPSKAVMAALPFSHFSQVTTSCGRLFDGVSAILGLCAMASYDGQAAAALENAAAAEILPSPDGLSFAVSAGEDGFVHLDWRPAVRWLLRPASPPAAGEAAWAFHLGLAKAVAEVCSLLRERTGVNHAALSGGVWQNALLLKMACGELSRRGFTVLTHRAIPPNDEGVSVGQALVAAHRFKKGADRNEREF
jgi:hydrogenase maturation protein HypF